MINPDNAKRIRELARTANNLAGQTESALQLTNLLSFDPGDLAAIAEEAESKEIIAFFKQIAKESEDLLQRLGG